MAAFRAAGADPTIGSRLQGILAAAGVEEVGGFAIAQYLASDNPVGPAVLSGRGPVTGAGHDRPRPDHRGRARPRHAGGTHRDTLRSADAVLVPPLLAGAWGRRP